MTVAAPDHPSPAGQANGVTGAKPGLSRARVFTIVLMIVSLLATATLQNYTASRHHELIRNTSSAATLGNLNSFSLALLLGGLRGPLVMMLWMTSENQKHDKNLEDFDTKIELIRLLQPEFDSVHLFQVWNKAYNISVQMANLPNKYAAILDALDYCHDIDEGHPNDINTYASFATIYFDKLGNSSEKYYYASRVRKDTQWREPDKLKRGDPGWRRTRLDPMLDPSGNLLSAYTAVTAPRPADLPGDALWNNGAELQYLEKFAPFPYGIPPMGLGYNYNKRAQVLQATSHQKHLQITPQVMDDRPAIDLKWWAEAENSEALWNESQAFGMQPSVRPTDHTKFVMAMSSDTHSIGPTTRPTHDSALPEAIYHYDLTIRICAEGATEFAEHLKRYSLGGENFHSQLQGLLGLQSMAAGDRDYLKAIQAQSPVSRKELQAQSAAGYRQAITRYQALVLAYYTPDRVIDRLVPTNLRFNLMSLAPSKINALYNAAFEAVHAPNGDHGKQADRTEFEAYILRCEQRLSLLGVNP